MRTLLSGVIGTEWEMIVVLSCLYGLRRGEVLGLRWSSINLKEGYFSVHEQMPFKPDRTTTIIEKMAPVKSEERVLPITSDTRSYFEGQKAMQERQCALYVCGGQPYYENDLAVCKSHGAPIIPDTISSNFAHQLRKLEMPYIRFHDLRHTAATNIYQLTGDFYTVGEIWGTR